MACSILFPISLLLFICLVAPIRCLSKHFDKIKAVKRNFLQSNNDKRYTIQKFSVPPRADENNILQTSNMAPSTIRIKRQDEKERLQKYISRAGISSRRKAEQLMQEGKVSVNGKVATEMGMKVNPKLDKVVVNGKLVTPITAKHTHWIMLNKPKGVATTMEHNKDRQNIYDLIPKAHDLRLVPVGRLSRNSTGLLLLTNEIEYIHRLTHPSFPISRRCELTIQGIPNEEALLALNHRKLNTSSNKASLRCNIALKEVDYSTGISILDVQSNHLNSALIALILDFLQCKLIRSKRTEFGPLRLNHLKRGEWRILLPAEVCKIKSSLAKSLAR